MIFVSHYFFSCSPVRANFSASTLQALIRACYCLGVEDFQALTGEEARADSAADRR